MENPFESGHIKNYVLLYASVVVIMILFFFASTLFNEVQEIDKKVFDTEVKDKVANKGEEQKEKKQVFKLMEHAYE
jgi:hypothetical protein